MFPSHVRTLVCRFQIESPLGTEPCWWIFPETEIVELLETCQRDAVPMAQTSPSTEMPALVERLPVELVVELGESRLTMAQLANLAVGDLLILNQTVQEPLSASLSGCPKFQGWPGRVGSTQAFQIEAEWDESR